VSESDGMTENRNTIFKSVPVLNRLSMSQIIMIGAGLLLAFGAFLAVRTFVLGAPSTFLPGVQVQSGAPTPSATDPVTGEVISAAPPADNLPHWDGASTFNILLLGLDYDDDNPQRQGPSRSDTMVLVSIDPVHKTAGMISIPRDLWVDIPGFDYNKINTAYFLGEANQLPGGGPALAAKTVEQLLGVPVQYYAVVSFDAFAKFVDEVGGIDVLSPYHFWIYPMGQEAMYLQEKAYHLDGQQALAYARNRHTRGGDVARSERTQQVLLAIRDRVLDPRILPSLLAKAPTLYQELASGLLTNISYDDALRMFSLAKDIPSENIQSRVIDYGMLQEGKSPDGLDIYTPIPDDIRELTNEVFGQNNTMQPAAQGADLVDLMKQEGATVSVLNGTYTEGLAKRTGDYLSSQGVNVVNVGNPDQIGYPLTIIIDTRGKPYMVKYLYDLFKVTSSSQHKIEFDPSSTADVIIIVGDDWVYSNPMP
jgi:polyisoprenyl-teichoic acid--peptidoglycan teichoic acid transferase